MRKKSYIPSIVLIALAVACLLVGVGVLGFGAGSQTFLSKQRPAFLVDALLCAIMAVVMAMLSSGRLVIPEKIARSKVTWAVVAELLILLVCLNIRIEFFSISFQPSTGMLYGIRWR